MHVLIISDYLYKQLKALAKESTLKEHVKEMEFDTMPDISEIADGSQEAYDYGVSDANIKLARKLLKSPK